MKNDERIPSRSGWNKQSLRLRAQSSKSQLLLALTIIAALFLSGCLKESRKGELAQNQAGKYAANTGVVASTDMSVAQPLAKQEADGREEMQGNTEQYSHIDENPFLEVARAPLSTFSIDVDTASYSNTRRFLKDGQLPPKDAVRIEELVNYFSYDYPQPVGDAPFSVTAEISEAPWNTSHRLVHIGLQGKRIAAENAIRQESTLARARHYRRAVSFVMRERKPKRRTCPESSRQSYL